MILKDGEFEARRNHKDMFSIIITQESDTSIDGGYTFESACNIFELSVQNAMDLVEELNRFIYSGASREVTS